MEKILKNKSRSRRLQYDWLRGVADKIHIDGKVLDLGGVRDAEYHSILKLKPENMIVWNFDPASSPDALVDLDKIKDLPPFPPPATTVLAMNLLEHLFRPFELLDWICRHLPSGGKVVIMVPFIYPIHPSPNDYWRIAPQAFERFFSELKQGGVSGKLLVEALGSDLREGTSILTSSLFKSTKSSRLLATVLESAGAFASALGGAVVGAEAIRKWAGENPPAIGVVWIKD